VLAHQPTATDLLFIPLRKSEALFSASATGQRYVHHAERGSRVLLFVREQRKQGTVTEPFMCLGFARYESHEGERPMAGGFSGVAAGAGDSGGVAARLLPGITAGLAV